MYTNLPRTGLACCAACNCPPAPQPSGMRIPLLTPRTTGVEAGWIRGSHDAGRGREGSGSTAATGWHRADRSSTPTTSSTSSRHRVSTPGLRSPGNLQASRTPPLWLGSGPAGMPLPLRGGNRPRAMCSSSPERTGAISTSAASRTPRCPESTSSSMSGMPTRARNSMGTSRRERCASASATRSLTPYRLPACPGAGADDSERN